MNPRLPMVSGGAAGQVLPAGPVRRGISTGQPPHADGRTVIVPLHRELATGTLASTLPQTLPGAAGLEALR